MILLAEYAGDGNSDFAILGYGNVSGCVSAGALESEHIGGKRKTTDDAEDKGSAIGASVSNMCCFRFEYHIFNTFVVFCAVVY